MSFKALATLDVQTKRATMVGGKRGEAVLHLGGLKAVSLQPASPELVLRLQLQTPHQVLETYIVGEQEIVTGDLLVVEGREYPVRGVAKWRAPGRQVGAYTHVVVEDVQL